jgi:DNA invertase Pin-like site-specific DNA recombinase
MARTPAERQAEYRQRKIAMGLKPLTLWLPPEALAVLERYPREQRDGIAAQAILAYNSNVTVSGNDNATVFNSNDLRPALEALTRRVEALEDVLTLRNSVVTKTDRAPWDISVQGHIEHEAQGEAVTVIDTPPTAEITDTLPVTTLPKPPARLPLEQIPDLIQKAKKQKAEGASWKEIARRFNAERIPTPSGKEKWFDKTVTRMVNKE